MVFSCGCVWCENKVQCCKEQYYIGTQMLGPRIMVLDMVKQEMARVSVNTLGISELKSLMGEFNSDSHFIY